MQWKLCEEGCWYDTVEAENVADALAIARDNVDIRNYNGHEGTLFINVRVRRVITDNDDSIYEEDEGSDTISLDPSEPECTHADGHNWDSPHNIVGGYIENPGVYGHGGGVTITSVCLRCGCKRVRDTWAQNPTTGEQGLNSLTYEIGAFEVES